MKGNMGRRKRNRRRVRPSSLFEGAQEPNKKIPDLPKDDVIWTKKIAKFSAMEGRGGKSPTMVVSRKVHEGSGSPWLQNNRVESIYHL